MTASLYQSALSGSAGADSGTATTWLFSRNTEDVRRQCVRIELDEIAPAAPGVMARGDQILERVAVARRAIEVEPSRLLMMRVEVDCDQDQVVAYLLRVAQHLVVVGRMEAQAPVALQRRIFLSHVVELGDQLAQAVGPVALPAPDLVLLGVEVLLAARLARRVLHQLERRAVHAVIRRQLRRHHGPADERR